MKSGKEKIKNIAVTVAVTIVITLFAAYACYHSIAVFDDTLMTGVIKRGSSREFVSLPCALFYDCYYLTDPKAESCLLTVDDGEKVAKDQEIARVYPTPPKDDVCARLASLRNQISFVTKCLDVGTLTHFSSGQALAREYIKYLAVSEHQSAALDKAAEELLIALNRYGVVSIGRSELVRLLESLEREYSGLEASLGDSYERITAAASGYVFDRSGMDGYESIFTADAATGLTPFDFERLMSTEPYAVPSDTYAVFMKSYTWLIATVMPDTVCVDANLAEGAQTELSLMGCGRSVPVTVRSISAAQNGEVAVVFECTSLAAEYIENRFDTISLCVTEHNGLAVPVSAVRNLNGMDGVYVLERGVLEFRRIQVLAVNNGYYIVSETEDAEADATLPPYPSVNDVVIVTGDGLYEGMVID